MTGHLLVDPQERDRAVALSREAVESARRAPGSLDFSVGPDSVDPARVNVAERWRSRATLVDFRGSGPGDELGDLVRQARVDEYEVLDPSSATGADDEVPSWTASPGSVKR